MSANYPNPLGFPASTSYGTGVSAFDTAGIAAQIERALGTLKPEERAAVTVSLDREKAGAGLVIRGPMNTSVLARVVKPYAGRFEWSLDARISFLKAAPDQVAVRVAPEVRGLYRLFRKLGHNRVTAAVRAVAVNRGVEVRIGK